MGLKIIKVDKSLLSGKSPKTINIVKKLEKLALESHEIFKCTLLEEQLINGYGVKILCINFNLCDPRFGREEYNPGGVNLKVLRTMLEKNGLFYERLYTISSKNEARVVFNEEIFAKFR